MVGTGGLEPPTPCSQSRCATRLRHVPALRPVYPRPLAGKGSRRARGILVHAHLRDDVGERCKPLAALPLERVGELAAHPDVLLWVDVTQPSLEELAALETTLALPSLAVEDAREAHQRPKVDHYDDCVVVVAYAAALDDARRARRSRSTSSQLFVSRRDG